MPKQAAADIYRIQRMIYMLFRNHLSIYHLKWAGIGSQDQTLENLWHQTCLIPVNQQGVGGSEGIVHSLINWSTETELFKQLDEVLSV